MSAIAIVLTVINATAWLLPDPADKFGWALRVRLIDSRQPYLVGEYLERRKDVHHPRLLVALGNQTKADRKYLLLGAARVAGYLRVNISRPNGKPLPWSYYNPGMKLQFDTRWDLAAGKWGSFDFDFRELDYGGCLRDEGVYELRALLKTDEGSIISPTIKFKVIEPAPGAILASQPVPLEGYEAKWPNEKQRRAAVQQITIENRTWLVYRQYLSPNDGGTANYTQRIAELPGKVDVKVEGAFSRDWKPLTITYKTSPTAEPTKLVINSVTGWPWTEEAEESWQERLKREREKSPPDAPPPPPVKP